MGRLAIAHEWLAVRAGSEKTFEAMAEAFPAADLYALTWNRDAEFEFGGRDVKTTPLDRTPFLRDRRELSLPLMPLAWRMIGADGEYDRVLTSSHACAKAFPPGRKAEHYCYVYAPMRYAWDTDIDARASRGGAPMRTALAALRNWDRRSADWVDHFAGISNAVVDRIRRFYDRDAAVIFPPVETDFFTPDANGDRHGALAVSRFIPYKRFDIAIEACAEAGIPLTVAGSGPGEPDLRRLADARGGDVTFEISPSDERLRELYRSSEMVIFAANEDFGIVPVEAQACGTPVVGLDEGGVRDTVVHEKTGYRVQEQTSSAFAEGIRALRSSPPAVAACRDHAETFSRDRFVREMRAWLGSEH